MESNKYSHLWDALPDEKHRTDLAKFLGEAIKTGEAEGKMLMLESALGLVTKEINRLKPGDALLPGLGWVELVLKASRSYLNSRMEDGYSDFYTERASFLFGVKPEEVTNEQREQAKVEAFASVYGMSEEGMADFLGRQANAQSDE